MRIVAFIFYAICALAMWNVLLNDDDWLNVKIIKLKAQIQEQN